MSKIFHQNWLINPASETESDDLETQEWQSRDIPPQRTVLTQRPPNFNSINEYREFELEFGVSCPIWQIEMGKKLQRVIETIFEVGDEEMMRPYSTYYSSSEGHILNRDRS